MSNNRNPLAIAAASLLGLCTISHALVVYNESFDYINGSNLTANNWTAFDSASTTQSGTVGTGLTFGSGVQLATSGGSAQISVTATSGSFRNAGYQSPDFGGSFSTINSGTLWRSQLFQATSANAVSGTNRSIDTNIVRYAVEGDASGNANRIPGSTNNDTQERKFTLNPKFFGGSGSTAAWGHNEGSTSATAALSQGQTYLFISSYDFATTATTIWVFDETNGQDLLNTRNVGTIDTADLNAFALSTQTVSTGSENLSVTADDSIAINFAFNNVQNSATSALLDEFRVGTDLNEIITVVPEPSTYAILSGMLALSFVMLRRNRK